MKKLLLALLLIPVYSLGQFSLRPYIGGGRGMISEKGFLTPNKPFEKSEAFIHNAGLSAVYWLNDWSVSAGIGYLTTGASYELDSFEVTVPREPSFYWTNVKTIHKYQHLVVPVTVGRKLSIKKLDLIAEVGIDFAYNLSEKSSFVVITDRTAIILTMTGSREITSVGLYLPISV